MRKRWTYKNPIGLTQGYGHVDYYGEYIAGYWFVLNADSGTEYWSKKKTFGHELSRPNFIFDISQDILVASEMRSDGPWTFEFGIYGYEVKTGRLAWTSHAKGLLGKLLRGLDAVPGFTNEFRDAPLLVYQDYVLTRKGRVLDIRTGLDVSGVNYEGWPARKTLDETYTSKIAVLESGELKIEHNHPQPFKVQFNSTKGLSWTYVPNEMGLHIDGNYYSWRFYRDHILLMLGDAPAYGPKLNAKGWQQNAARYQLCVIGVNSGRRNFYPIEDGEPCLSCRIEALSGNRVLVNRDDRMLIEYELNEI